MIKKNSLVQIYQVVLQSNKRADNLPSDTLEVPFEVRIKGSLLEDANLGDFCKIITQTGRIESGILIAENPYYQHNFGHHVEILREIKAIILKEMEDLL